VSTVGVETDAGRTATESAATRRLVSPVLMGRDAELECLVRAVWAPPAVVIVEGEAGIGKTRLVEELMRSGGIGKSVLLGRCHRIREPFPLGPVIEAVRAIGPSAARLELSPVAGALRPLLPELDDALPDAPPPLGDRAAERHRLYRALTELLGALGERVIVLEDLHWTDDHTLEFLRFLLAEPPQGLALVLTYRGDEASGVLRGLTARLPAALGRLHVVLAGLNEIDTGALAAALLDAPAVSPEFAACLRERTSGVPFAIEELLALLRDREYVARRGDRWAHRALDAIQVPTAIAYSVRERAATLSWNARTVVEATALLRVAAPPALIAATAGLAEVEAENALFEAIGAGLLERSGARIGFRHVLAAEAIEESIPGTRQRALHRRAAIALRASDPCPLGQLAHHLRLVGLIDEWAQCAEEAADHACRLGDDAEAVRLLKEVLREAPLDPAGRARVALKLAHSAIHGLAHTETLEILFDTLETGSLSQADRAELRLLFSRLLGNAGDHLRRAEQLEQAVSDLDGHPALQVRAMSMLVLPDGLRTPIDEHVAWMKRSVDLLPAIDDPAVEAAVLGDSTTLLLAMGDGTWRRMRERIPSQAGSPAEEWEIERARCNVANGASYVGHSAVATALIETGLANAERIGYGRMHLIFKVHRAIRDYGVGDWRDLPDTVAALLEDVADVPAFRAAIEWVAGCLSLAHGELSEARKRLDDALAVAESVQTVWELAPAAGALARLQLARDDPAAARDSAMRCVSVLWAKGLWTLAGPAAPAAVQALIKCGDRPQAERLVARFAGGVAGRDAPIASAALAVCRGILAEPGDAAQSFVAAARAYSELPCPYEAAQATERAALSMFAAGSDGAAEHLLEALTTYKELGAAWDAARCSQAARAHGLPVPRPYRGGRKGYGAALTPRELEVAQLATRGLSNKEIAHELFLSTRTVESHLGRAMAKLEVRSRAAIAGQLGTKDQGFPSTQTSRSSPSC
jgi:DNA-binding CsgD family transcriptional regulator